MTTRSIRGIEESRKTSADQARSKHLRREARMLAAVTGVLIVLGVLALFSATSTPLAAEGEFPYAPILKHLAYIGSGLLLAGLVAAALPKLSETAIRRSITAAFLVNLALLVACFSPLGVEINNAKRWVRIAGIVFQPSELLKITLVLLIAAVLIEGGKRAFRSFRSERGVVFTLRRGRIVLAWAYFAVMLCLVLIALQPDLGTMFILFGTALATLLLAGVSLRSILKFLIVMIIAGLVGCLILPGKYDYAKERILTHISPTKDVSGDAYQLTQSFGAISQAGLFGRGYMRSLQKMNRLPLHDKDFIYAIWVEETGILGGVAVLALFIGFAFICLRISMKLPFGFESVAILGLGFSLSLQAVVNISTNVGMLPVSGMTLPFFSSGGTSVLVSTLIVGIILGLVQRKLPRGKLRTGAN